MAQSDLSRSAQPRKRRPLVAFIIIVVLCLVAFGLGVFVGKQQGGQLPVAVTQQVTPPPAAKHVVVPQSQEVPTVVIVNPACEPASAVAAPVAASPVAADVVTPGGSQASVAEQATIDPLQQLVQHPLGNGMNQVTQNSTQVAMVTVPASGAVEQVVPAAVVTPPVVAQPIVPHQEAIASSTGKTVAAVRSAQLVTSGYVVQVGSFKNRADAEKLVVKLKPKFTVLVKQVDLASKGVWFRVLVGPVSTPAAAKKLQDKLISSCKLSGFVKKLR